jgi:hypothetical protein
MPFNDLLTDTVTLLKQDGKLFENIKASVQKKKIFIQRSDVLVESGDLIRRRMSNGAEETYKVIDPGFHEQFHSIPAGYQMDVIKLGIPEAQNAIQHITYNISGTNNRINQNSSDSSINITNKNTDIQEHIEQLRAELKKLNLKTQETTESYEVIDEIESQLKKATPNKTVVRTLLSGLPNAGNIASIGSLIVSLLG